MASPVPLSGAVVGGFRIERLIGSGPSGAVYQATQISLERTVALRLLGPEHFADPENLARFESQQLLSASLHHPNVIPTYEAGEWEGGRFVATRYIRGRTLEEWLNAGDLAGPGPSDLLAPIAGALESAHDAGLVHGRVSARNVVVDAAGNVHLADLGLGRPGSASADRMALAELESQVARNRGGSRKRRRRFLGAASIGLAGLAVLAVVLATAGGGDSDPGDDPPPPLAAGAVALGSELAPGAVRGMGCSVEPGPNTPACTLGQAVLVGKPVKVSEAGVIRDWAVRGASGDLTLQIVGRRDGRVFLRGFSQAERVSDPGPHEFGTNVAVRPGDRIGVLLAPGASIGTRAGADGTTTLRWEGSLPFAPAQQTAARLDEEILLRADLDPGAEADLPEINGHRAGEAPAGEVIATQVVTPSSGGGVRVELVRVGNAIAIDAFRGGRRLTRIEVPDAAPDGGLISFESACGYRRGFCLRWQNQDDPLPVVHAYRLSRSDGGFRPIG